VTERRSTTTAPVSVVLLNFNSGELGAAAARSVRRQTYPSVELVVVDNASVDDSVHRVVYETEPDQLEVNEINSGFSGGMNTGFGLASGDFVLPLNCDAELADDYVERAMEVHQAHPRTAVVGGRVESPTSGVTGPIRITATMRTAALSTDSAQRCDKVDGSCPLQRREAIEEVAARYGVGPYDPTYDTYGEDVDLALKLRRLGWEVRYTPTARATHLRSFSSAHRLADRRGRLRINNLANRHRNLLRHGSLALWPVLAAQDAGFAAIRLARRDHRAAVDVAAAWRRVSQTATADLALRRQG
jgi:GT2 family glycosyltransferase